MPFEQIMMSFLLQTHLHQAAHPVYFHTFSIDLGVIFIAGDLACPFSWQISHKKFDVLSTSLPPIALQHSVKEETICSQYHEHMSISLERAYHKYAEGNKQI